MQYIYIITSRECIHNLFFYVLYSRQAIFIYSIRSKTVDLFTLFFTLSTLLFVGYFQSYAVGVIICFFFFLTHAFFNNGGPSWVGIKIGTLLYKVHSKLVKNEKKCLSKSLFKSAQTFSDYKPGGNLNESWYLPGLLMSYSRLFHAKA